MGVDNVVGTDASQRQGQSSPLLSTGQNHVRVCRAIFQPHEDPEYFNRALANTVGNDIGGTGNH
jgi:hypothetical protein